MQDNSFMQQFEQECKKLVKRDVDELKKLVEGRGRVNVSTKDQMAAYEAMTAEDMNAMMQQVGLNKFNEHVGDMEMRKRRMKNALSSAAYRWAFQGNPTKEASHANLPS